MADSTSSFVYSRDVSAHSVRYPLLREWGKRVFDVVCSFFGLLIVSPVFLFVAMRLRRDSPGPLFYRGRRIGRGEKEFKILKFRTMYERPESYQGLHVTAKNDDRITPFGEWLRDTKVNELPQLWNVLIGQMSMVGPRPEDPDIAATWPEEVRKDVLSVRPGITSPASVIYRDEESMLAGLGVMNEYLHNILPKKLRLDQLYVRHHSFMTDMDVIFMTLIMLLPRLRSTKVQENHLFSGPFFNFASRYLTWYLIDTAIAFLAVGFTGILWRINSPLDIGVGHSLGIAVAIALLLGFTHTLLGIKKITWRYADAIYAIDLGVSTGFTLILLGLADYFLFDPPLIPLRMIWDFGLLAYVGFVAIRYRERLFTGFASRWLRFRGRNASIGEQVLIVGAGECGELAVWLLKKSKYANLFSAAGFVDDDFHKQNYKINNCPILGTTRDILEIVESKGIGLIFFAISKCSESVRERILADCRRTNARVVIIPDLMEALENSMRGLVPEEN